MRDVYVVTSLLDDDIRKKFEIGEIFDMHIYSDRIAHRCCKLDWKVAVEIVLSHNNQAELDRHSSRFQHFKILTCGSRPFRVLTGYFSSKEGFWSYFDMAFVENITLEEAKREYWIIESYFMKQHLVCLDALELIEDLEREVLLLLGVRSPMTDP